MEAFKNDQTLLLSMQIQHANIRITTNKHWQRYWAKHTRFHKTWTVSDQPSPFQTLEGNCVPNTLIMSPQRRSITEHKYKFNSQTEQTVPVVLNLQAITLRTGLWLGRILQVPWQRYCTVCFYSKFFLPALFLLAAAPGATCGGGWKKKRDNGTHEDASRSQSSVRAGRHSPFFSLAARGQDGGGRGIIWMREAIGVSVRWGFLKPHSLLQPRVSPMGCNGIKYSASMQPKTRGAPLQLARVDRSGAAHKCRKTESELESFSAASGAGCFISLPAAI